MDCLFVKRYFQSGTTVTISGSGYSPTFMPEHVVCYVRYNNQSYYNGGDSFTLSDDARQLVFSSFGGEYEGDAGWIKINGETKKTFGPRQGGNYTWTVPDGASSVNVNLVVKENNAGQINVITT